MNTSCFPAIWFLTLRPSEVGGFFVLPWGNFPERHRSLPLKRRVAWTRGVGVSPLDHIRSTRASSSDRRVCELFREQKWVAGAKSEMPKSWRARRIFVTLSGSIDIIHLLLDIERGVEKCKRLDLVISSARA